MKNNLLKLNRFSKNVSVFLSIFYGFSGVYLFSLELYSKSILAFILSSIFLFLYFVNKIGQLANDKISLIESVLDYLKIDLENNDENRRKLMIFLFLVDNSYYNKNKKTLFNIFWFKINYRPNSPLIIDTINNFLNKKSSLKKELNKEIIECIDANMKAFNLSFLELDNLIRSEFKGFENLKNDYLIRFKHE